MWSEGKQLWVTIGVVTLIAGIFICPLLVEPFAISSNDDWTQMLAFQTYLEDQLTMHFSLPMRSHVLGGGFPIIGHPEYPIISPLTLTTLVFGAVLGAKINLIMVYALGLFGMWSLCHSTYKLRPSSAAYATLVFAVAGWYPAILYSGNYPQMYYLWFPLLAYLLFDERLFDGRLILATLVAATMLTDGHLNSICCFVMLAFWAAFRSRKTLARVALFAVCTGAVAAFKLLPAIALLLVEDRSIDVYSSTTIETATFNWEDFGGTGADMRSVDGFALGPIPWLLALGGIAVWRKTWRLASLLGISVLFWMGPHAPIDIFYLLTRLPVLSSIDAPSKYFVFFVGFTVILVGAHAIDAWPEKLHPKWSSGALTLVAVGMLFLPGSTRLGQVFSVTDPPRETRAFVQVDTPYFVEDQWTGPESQRPDLYFYYRKGLGIVRWEDNFQLPSNVIAKWQVNGDGTLTQNQDYKGEVWLTAGQGSAKLNEMSANAFTVEVNATSKTELTVNQVYDSNWQCTSGEIVNRGGLMALPVASGSSQIECEYSSPVFRAGLGISIIALLFMLIAWRRFGRDVTK